MVRRHPVIAPVSGNQAPTHPRFGRENAPTNVGCSYPHGQVEFKVDLNYRQDAPRMSRPTPNGRQRRTEPHATTAEPTPRVQRPRAWGFSDVRQGGAPSQRRWMQARNNDIFSNFAFATTPRFPPPLASEGSHTEWISCREARPTVLPCITLW